MHLFRYNTTVDKENNPKGTLGLWEQVIEVRIAEGRQLGPRSGAWEEVVASPSNTLKPWGVSSSCPPSQIKHRPTVRWVFNIWLLCLLRRAFNFADGLINPQVWRWTDTPKAWVVAVDYFRLWLSCILKTANKRRLLSGIQVLYP